MVSPEFKAHILALFIGRYFNTAALIGCMSIETWLSIVFGLVEAEIKQRVLATGGVWKEIPVGLHGPTLAMTLIARWKAEPSLHERFPAFIDFVDYAEQEIEEGRAIDNIKS